MTAEWYDDRRNLAAVARYMGEQGDSADDVAYMLEKPQKFGDEWQAARSAGGVEGCDCTELCDMGPTCPGGMLARLPGSGCARMAERERLELPCNADGIPHSAHVWDFGSGEEFVCRGASECATCSGRGVWMDEPCGDCSAEQAAS